MEDHPPLTSKDDQRIASLVSDWVEAANLRLRASLRVAMAETKLAVTTFALMIFLVVLAAGAVLLAWLLLLVALVQVLALVGLQLVLAIMVVAVLHLAAAWALWRLATRLGRHMEFRATRQLLESQ